jgi:murein DD-endopeptidase MepM/ murein hydrolase activator NlpD
MATQVYLFTGLTKDQAQQKAQEAKDLAGDSNPPVEILLQPGAAGTQDLYSLRVTYPDPADPASTPKPMPPQAPGPQPPPQTPIGGAGPVAPAEPPDDPAPFAAFAAAGTSFWPVVDPGPNTRLVSYHPSPDKTIGNIGRCFFDDRPGRHHVGVDLFAEEGDPVVACADGKIVSFYKFYNSKGRDTFALVIAHDGVVINYGEVGRIPFRSSD